MQASCETTVPAYAVLLREPLKPQRPPLLHDSTLPRGSVMLTVVYAVNRSRRWYERAAVPAR